MGNTWARWCSSLSDRARMKVKPCMDDSVPVAGSGEATVAPQIEREVADSPEESVQQFPFSLFRHRLLRVAPGRVA